MATRATLSDRNLRVLLVLLTLALRVPFWSTFDFVTFDGAFYVNQAKALLHGSLGGGVFSIGYPLAIAPLAAILDGVVAARLVSLVAAVGSVLLMFELCRSAVDRTLALLGALVLTAAPLFVQTSLLTNAESLLVFWLLLGAVFYARAGARATRSGLAIGMAVATRPEALAVGGVLALLRVRNVRATAAFVIAFAAVYAPTVAINSVQRGVFTPLARSGAYSYATAPWQVQEKSLAFESNDAAAGADERVDRVADYRTRMPRLLLLLGRQLFPLVTFLALFGMVRRPSFVLALLAPLPFLPLFSLEREQTRWLVPYLPPLVYFAMAALGTIRHHRARTIAIAMVVLSTGACFWLNRALFADSPEGELVTAREVGRRFASRVASGDMMADRKPYLALYAGARYVEIPVAPYDDTLDHLATGGVRYLSLHPKSVALRPALLPLVFDAAAVRGELRYRQVVVETTGEMILERTRADDPVSMRSLTQEKAIDFAPAWSPDGSRLAFRRATPDGVAAIWLVDVSGANARELVRTSLERDALAWSGDGRRIAYASFSGDQLDLFAVDVATGRVSALFESSEYEWSPSWGGQNGALFFCGDHRGFPSAWRLEPGKAPERLSEGDPADLASVSPSGRNVTWVDLEGRLVVLEMDSRHKRVIDEPRQILSVASWSPDERYLAVEAYDWGSSNVYIIDVHDGRAMMLTKAITGEGMPSWSPRGDAMACLLDRDGTVTLSMLENFSEHMALFAEGDGARVFDRPQETRVAPRENLRRVRAESRRP